MSLKECYLKFERSIQGQPAKILVPSRSGVHISFLGAITANLSLRKPQPVVGSKKKRKLNEGEQQITGKIGLIWSKLEARADQELLPKDHSLTTRILNSAYNVTPNDCKEWIRHLKTITSQPDLITRPMKKPTANSKLAQLPN
ncbi:hypothetical protein BDC45DRAFT_554257 [Circinella umbellata]|nr:hypothetical protein BDC45DRAFT_554257 [Circinella umbellata]